MDNNFDIIVGRDNTSSLKWNKYTGTDIIPMWVADMDFKSPPAVIEKLHERIDHGVFGYTDASAELQNVIVNRLSDKYNWQIEAESIVWLPGLVPALHLACQSTAKKDDEIITFTPVYPPFFTASMPTQKLKTIPLQSQDNRYTFNLEAFKKEITSKSKLLMLCNPHNPVGRAYNHEELKAVVEICLDNNITICSDEIHCDLILDDKPHIPTATISAEAANNSITLMSPSKTFNLAGLNCSLAIIPNDGLRKNFIRERSGIVPYVNALGYSGCLAAYGDSNKWYKDLIEYLKSNRDMLEDFINKTPQLSMNHIEATYLAWIDVSKLNLSDPAGFFENAGVGLSDGKYFGKSDHLRLNFGCPKQTLTKALERIKTAICNL